MNDSETETECESEESGVLEKATDAALSCGDVLIDAALDVF